MLSSLALPCLPNHELVVALRCHRLLFTKKQNDVVVQTIINIIVVIIIAIACLGPT